VDEVFRALNDASRRLLLDRLQEQDGQTLTELCRHLPDLTRHGVMSHLGVLEEGGLITTERVGRNKHHYLNVVPIRLVHDRWINKFTEPWAGALSALKAHLEHDPDRGASCMSIPTHVYEAYIRCSPEAAWRALTDGDQTVHYYYGTRLEAEWTPGSSLRYLADDGTVVADGEVLAAEEPSRLEMLFHPRWDPELEAEGPVRMVWLVEAQGELTSVRVEYHDLDPASRTYEDFAGGIPFIVSGLKTLLETGAPITSP
jgi:DNA-binding transcriptional ArsR family regulator/uncharacterized protein YndB with AHSA1/START domain